MPGMDDYVREGVRLLLVYFMAFLVVCGIRAIINEWDWRKMRAHEVKEEAVHHLNRAVHHYLKMLHVVSGKDPRLKGDLVYPYFAMGSFTDAYVYLIPHFLGTIRAEVKQVWKVGDKWPRKTHRWLANCVRQGDEMATVQELIQRLTKELIETTSSGKATS